MERTFRLMPIDIDPSGVVLCPGHRDICRGNGEHPPHECCCDECAHFLKCYPEYQAEVDEALEILRDRAAYKRAMEEHQKDPTTYTSDEVLQELGVTHEELAALHPAELETDE